MLSLSLDCTYLIVLSIFSDICYTVSSVPNVVIVKYQRKWKGQSSMYNSETMTTLGTLDTV
jgi:hypothetical protein